MGLLFFFFGFRWWYWTEMKREGTVGVNGLAVLLFVCKFNWKWSVEETGSEPQLVLKSLGFCLFPCFCLLGHGFFSLFFFFCFLCLWMAIFWSFENLKSASELLIYLLNFQEVLTQEGERMSTMSSIIWLALIGMVTCISSNSAIMYIWCTVKKIDRKCAYCLWVSPNWPSYYHLKWHMI